MKKRRVARKKKNERCRGRRFFSLSFFSLLLSLASLSLHSPWSVSKEFLQNHFSMLSSTLKKIVCGLFVTSKRAGTEVARRGRGRRTKGVKVVDFFFLSLSFHSHFFVVLEAKKQSVFEKITVFLSSFPSAIFSISSTRDRSRPPLVSRARSLRGCRKKKTIKTKRERVITRASIRSFFAAFVFFLFFFHFFDVVQRSLVVAQPAASLDVRRPRHVLCRQRGMEGKRLNLEEVSEGVS